MDKLLRLFIGLLLFTYALSLEGAQVKDSYCQVPDTIVPPVVNTVVSNNLADQNKMQQEIKKTITSDTTTVSSWHPNSTIAMLCSIIPGGGQIYNRKYWKVPIVYGAFTACIYAVTWNSRTYNEYRNAYRDYMSSDPVKNNSWLDFAPYGAKAEDYKNYSQLKESLKRGNDAFRRYRDLSIIVTVGVYLLSFLDAYVDAQLYEFDISPDLSMRLTPDVQINNNLSQGVPSMGVNCSFTF